MKTVGIQQNNTCEIMVQKYYSMQILAPKKNPLCVGGPWGEEKKEKASKSKCNLNCIEI